MGIDPIEIWHTGAHRVADEGFGELSRLDVARHVAEHRARTTPWIIRLVRLAVAHLPRHLRRPPLEPARTSVLPAPR